MTIFRISTTGLKKMCWKIPLLQALLHLRDTFISLFEEVRSLNDADTVVQRVVRWCRRPDSVLRELLWLAIPGVRIGVKSVPTLLQPDPDRRPHVRVLPMYPRDRSQRLLAGAF